MKYLVTITEVHEVVVEAESAEDAENFIRDEVFCEATDGNYRAVMNVDCAEYGGNDSADFTADGGNEDD